MKLCLKKQSMYLNKKRNSIAKKNANHHLTKQGCYKTSIYKKVQYPQTETKQ